MTCVYDMNELRKLIGTTFIKVREIADYRYGREVLPTPIGTKIVLMEFCEGSPTDYPCFIVSEDNTYIDVDILFANYERYPE